IEERHGYAREWYTLTIGGDDTDYGYDHDSANHTSGWRGAVYQNGALLDWQTRNWDRPGPASEIPTVHSEQFCVEVVGSWDPNEKVGPAGAIPGLNFVAQDADLPYTIYFENDPELATAPAQEVQITDNLDEDLDLSTFELTQIAFADHVIEVPTGRAYYETTVDLQPEGIPVLVQIEVG
ncbi:unnamed protein product, partial [marine sediment metagenome]